MRSLPNTASASLRPGLPRQQRWRPRAGLAALGVAYVLFACDQPSLFKLMFGPTIEKKSGHPVLDEAGSACFNALRQAVAAAKFFEGDPDGGDVSLACWSLVHGLSALIVDGRLAEYDSDPAEAVATRLTRLLSDSLAALAEKKSGRPSRAGVSTPFRRGEAPSRSTPLPLASDGASYL